MKVLMVATSYPRFCGDSAAVFLQYLARAIGRDGHDVHVLVPNDPLADDSLNDRRVTVHRFGYFPVKRPGLAYGSGILPNLRASRRLYLQVPFFLGALFVSLIVQALRVRPDVIHAHWVIPAGFVAVLVGKLLGIPVITTVHGGDAFVLRSPFFRWLRKFTLNNSSVWTSNTRSTANAAMNGCSGINAPEVIPMGVDVQLFASGNRVAHRSGMDEQEQVILYVGRLVKKKGCKVLVEAFRRVVEDYHGKVTLWFAGDGDDRVVLERLIAELGLSGRVRFFGARPNENLPDIYAGADLFVLPSVTEGQGVVLLEAMAGSVPVIANKVGGIGEVIENNITGWLVKPSDPGLLGERICACLDAPHLRAVVAANARNRVMSYDWPVVAQSFVELYEGASR
ncbi:MAG: glycosyltransferase [Thiogranum sp.]